MKAVIILLVAIQAVLIQNISCQVIRSVGVSTPIVAQPSVANTLADTLSLLTVSSLLAESLPYNPTVIAAMPTPACAPAVSYGGCGCGYNGYGYLY